MKPLLNTVALLVAAVLGAIALGNVPAASQTTPATGPVAFLDLSKALRRYEKAKAIRLETEERAREVEEKLRVSYEELRGEVEALELLERGTEKYTDEKRRLDLKAFQLDYRKNEMLEAVRVGRAQKMVLVYTEIQSQAEVYSRKNGYRAVFMVNASEIEARSAEEVTGQIWLRPVLYWDKSLDITDQILEILNQE